MVTCSKLQPFTILFMKEVALRQCVQLSFLYMNMIKNGLAYSSYFEAGVTECISMFLNRFSSLDLNSQPNR